MDVSNAEDIGAWIEDELNCELVDRGQSNKFACEDFEKFMEALRQGWLKHTGDRDLTRHVLNAISDLRPTATCASIDPPSSAARPSCRTRVIDRLTAAAMVHTDAAFELAAAATSLYLASRSTTCEDRPGLLLASRYVHADRPSSSSTPSASLSLDEWAQQFTYANHQYPLYGYGPSYPNEKLEEISHNFRSYVGGGFMSNVVVFACILARLQVFSQARFQFRS